MHMVPSERGCVPLTDYPLASAKNGNGKVAIFSQNRMHLVNTSEEEPLVVSRGTLLAGFGRGKWEQTTDETESKQILYTLTDHTQLVLTGNDLVSLHDVVNERRKTNLNCLVAYRDLVPQAEGPAGAFSLAVVTQIAFRPQPTAEDAPPAHLQTRVAATIRVSVGLDTTVDWSGL